MTSPLIIIAIAMILSGCRRNEQAVASQTVASVGPATLLSDAARLASKTPDKVGFPVDPSILPASFRAFNPVETWRYDQSFLIVTARYFQHRVGVLVQPLNYPEPKATGNDSYTKLAPGIYFYSS